jgi:hypothetical protein
MEWIKKTDGTKSGVPKPALGRTFFNKQAAELYADLMRKQGRDAFVTEKFGGGDPK